MSPAGAVPAVASVAPSSVAANSLALAGSRPMSSTVLPPASARSAKALAMLPRPMMLMLLMKSPLSVDDQKVDSSTIPEIGDASTNQGSVETDGTELAERS